MGSRERKRDERRKRKERRADEPAVGSPKSADGDARPSRSELKNIEAREQLEPLHEDERPGVVTVGAVISGLIALSTLIAYIAGATVDGERPKFLQFLAPTLLMGMMSFGMWRARYWAVLGFQVVLLFLILASSISLLQVASIASGVYSSILLLGSGVMFYLMVKAMARIQMPQRLPPK